MQVIMTNNMNPLINNIIGSYISSRPENTLVLKVSLFKHSFRKMVGCLLDFQNNIGTFIEPTPQRILKTSDLEKYCMAAPLEANSAPCPSTPFDSFLVNCISCGKRVCNRHVRVLIGRVLNGKPPASRIQSFPELEGYCCDCLKDNGSFLTLSKVQGLYDEISIELINWDRDPVMKKCQSFLVIKQDNKRLSFGEFLDYFDDNYALNLPNLLSSLDLSAGKLHTDFINMISFYTRYNKYILTLLHHDVLLSTSSSEVELNHLLEKIGKIKASMMQETLAKLKETQQVPDTFSIYTLALANVLNAEKMPFNYQVVFNKVKKSFKTLLPSEKMKALELPVANGPASYNALISRIYMPANWPHIPERLSRMNWQHLHDNHDLEFLQKACNVLERYLSALSNVSFDIEPYSIENLCPLTFFNNKEQSEHVITSIIDLVGHMTGDLAKFNKKTMEITAGKQARALIQEFLAFNYITREDNEKLIISDIPDSGGALFNFIDQFKHKYIWETEEGYQFFKLGSRGPISFSPVFTGDRNSSFLIRSLKTANQSFKEYSEIFTPISHEKRSILDSLLTRIFISALAGKFHDGTRFIELDERKQNSLLLLYYEYVYFWTFFMEFWAFIVRSSKPVEELEVKRFLTSLASETKLSHQAIDKRFGFPLLITDIRALSSSPHWDVMRKLIDEEDEQLLLDFQDHHYSIVCLSLVETLISKHLELIKQYMAWLK